MGTYLFIISCVHAFLRQTYEFIKYFDETLYADFYATQKEISFYRHCASKNSCIAGVFTRKKNLQFLVVFTNKNRWWIVSILVYIKWIFENLYGIVPFLEFLSISIYLQRISLHKVTKSNFHYFLKKVVKDNAFIANVVSSFFCHILSCSLFDLMFWRNSLATKCWF